MMGFLKRKIKLQSINVQIPWVGNASFVPDEAEERTAWALYVELSTRVAIEPIDRDNGSLREALTSIYHLFGAMRVILRESGAGVGRKKSSLGQMAIVVMNSGLRPYLTEWHNKLKQHESVCPAGTSPFQWERQWTLIDEFYRAMDDLKSNLEAYRTQLCIIARLETCGS